MSSLLLVALLHGPCAPSLQPLAARWASEHAAFACDDGGRDFALVDRVPPKDATSKPIPVAVGAVGVAYNLTVAGDLRLSAELVAGIYQGRIRRWNDPAIAAVNPGVLLPDVAVTVVRQDVAALEQLDAWLGALGGAGERAKPSKDGGAAAIARTEGAVGALDAAKARRASLYLASLRNRDGAFVQPGMHSVTRAAVGLRIPDDFRVSIVGASGIDSYPIVAFAYAVIPKGGEESSEAASLFRWIIHDGQRSVVPLGWAPLPGLVVRMADEQLASLAGNR